MEGIVEMALDSVPMETKRKLFCVRIFCNFVAVLFAAILAYESYLFFESADNQTVTTDVRKEPTFEVPAILFSSAVDHYKCGTFTPWYFRLDENNLDNPHRNTFYRYKLYNFGAYNLRVDERDNNLLEPTFLNTFTSLDSYLAAWPAEKAHLRTNWTLVRDSTPVGSYLYFKTVAVIPPNGLSMSLPQATAELPPYFQWVMKISCVQIQTSSNTMTSFMQYGDFFL